MTVKDIFQLRKDGNIDEAWKAGYSMPKLEMLEAELKFLASKNKRQGA